MNGTRILRVGYGRDANATKKPRPDCALPFATQPHLTIVLRRPNSNLFQFVITEKKSRPDRALPFTTRPQPTVVTKRRPNSNSFSAYQTMTKMTERLWL